MFSFFSEDEESDAGVSAEDDEIFFGPVGHTEKCVAVAVNEVVQASDRLRPLSPLSATQMAELCREAYTVAYQISHADSSQLPSSHAGTSSSDAVTGINPVKDLTSIVTETDRRPSLDKTLTGNTAEDLTPDNTISRQELCGQGNDKTFCSNSFKGVLSSPGSTLPDLTSNVAETGRGICVDETLSSSTADDLIPVSTEISRAQDNDSTLSTNSFEDVLVLSSLRSALPNVEDLTSNVAETDTNSFEDAPVLFSGSALPDIEDLSSHVDETDRVISVDETLSSSTADDLTSGSTEISSGQGSDNTSSTNSFEGLLSSLGSALPVIDSGSLIHDEHGVVKFTAAAADSASVADANAKCRSGIPTTSGLRRAFSAKASATRPSGIPLKGLAVRHDVL